MRLLTSALFALIVLFFTNQIYSQTFGFGCLGFVGGYGGYTYQQYNAEGLNSFIQSFNETRNSSINSFNDATGYRIGINLFRATFKGGFIVTAKGYYQSLSKKNKSTNETEDGLNDFACDLDLRNWGVGLDLGVDLFKGLSWKVIDGAVHFNNVKFTTTENYPGNSIINEYKSDGNNFSYSIGTGLIVSIIQDYISIEGLAGYTSLKIEEVKTDSGNPQIISDQDNQNFIDSGGFTAVIQLNVGIPL